MKILLVLTTAFLLIVSAGCGSQAENETAKLAREHWKLTQLGGSNYLCQTTQATKGSGPMPIDDRASKTVFELRNPRIEVHSSPLSDADKLNGIEWSGWVKLNVDAYRRYSPIPYSGSQPDKTWSGWVSGGQDARPGDSQHKYIDSMTIKKVKGQWEVVPSSASVESNARMFMGLPNFSFKEVSASDLPQ